jgi:hypothetical protein
MTNLKGKKLYEDVKISTLRDFRVLLAQCATPQRRFVPAAQVKIDRAQKEWDAILDDANRRIAAIRETEDSDEDKATAIALIENEQYNVYAYEIHPITEWSQKNSPDDMAMLRACKMLVEIEITE